MSNKLTLYYSQGACALGPQIALREAGLDFDLVRVNLKEHKLHESGEDYYKIAPKGAVPALRLPNGEVLTEGPAIMQWIADQAPTKKLAPANGTLERSRLQEHLNYITSELHKGTGMLFNQDMPADFRKFWKERVTKKYAYIDEVLAQKPYLMGKEFTVADGYLYNVTRWTNYDSIKLETGHLKNLQGFMQRMAERPAVQAALKAEGIAA
ncbi:MAG: glutathione transferase GstA [Proteobacteria bacterium]|nr:glutathione transferase GstA [Pseudomonadota bacterium]